MPASEFSTRFLSMLPEGASPDDVVILECAAKAVPVSELTPDEKAAIASFTKAGPDPVDASGKPTIMRVTAWMVHEGVNLNRQVFIKEELEAAAKGLFASPNFGVMDFNHSAVIPWSEDPKVIGLWHKAEFAYDKSAEKWGILASGIMWAWLFPDHADVLLADQARRGYMRFSMACLSQSQEYVTYSDGPARILHNPIFFTVSALDVPPADPNAKGLGSEDPEDTEETLQRQLTNVASHAAWTAAQATETTLTSGDGMDNAEIIERLTSEKLAAETALSKLQESFDTHRAEKDTEVAEVTAKVENLENKVAELETVRDGLIAEKEAAEVKVAELTARIAELEVIEAKVKADEAAKAKSEVISARFAELPESYRLIHEKKNAEAKARVEDRWAAMSAEEWTEYKEEILGYNPAAFKTSFLDRSQNGVRIPDIGADSADEPNLSARAKKLLR